MAKKKKKSIEEELQEKLGPDTYDYVSELLNFLKEIVEQEGGLPDPEANPEFYQAIDTFLELAKNNLLDITQKDLAEYLGVDYNLLRRNRSRFHRMQKKAEEQREEEAQYDAVADIAQPAPAKPAPKPPERTQSFTHQTETKLDKQVSNAIAKKMEHVVKEEVDQIFNLGKIFVSTYKQECYRMGHESLEECLREAMEFYINARDEYEYMKTVIDKYKATIRYLVLLNKPTIQRMLIVEKAKRMIEAASRLPPRKQNAVVNAVLRMLERV